MRATPMQTPRLILIAGAVLVLGSVSLACEISAPIWFPDGDADPLYRIVRGNYAGYIDGTGRVVIPPKFADTENNLGDEFHNGRLAVREIEQGRSGYRYVDLRGNVVSTSFSFAEQFSEGLALVRPTWNGPYGYIDVDGRVVIPPRFEQADSFSNGM
ncbi:MAG TPA: WG repeat-containing protein, partial [Terriglobia bacterium]|nr:WG repeat-containing protein [Terriglobia bacterium]